MARPVRRKGAREREFIADEILRRYEVETRERVELPIPIEAILEVVYGLQILYGDIAEPPNTRILGALSPDDKTVVLNERHLPLFESVIGPERFTYAHELAHWIYDVGGNPSDGGASNSDRFCYYRDAEDLDATTRVRETNANELAASILLPARLLKRFDIETITTDIRATAAAWGVSQQCLEIRIDELNLYI